ncbi:transposase [Methylobacter sp. S3L5C]|uniref:transposase n=1 Tax=Methylobacter sp. S3L5C TaxID=2839024 RepID=UPI001FAC2103|nr:transposase [Methylobacter sp. S3L5C]UOA09542.1 transposase [Methylobacter sp. S3L5C]
MTRIERQASVMDMADMLNDLPTAYDVDTKKNSKGYKISWIGYKLHIDVADGGIPISVVLTSASTHDSQVAIQLAIISNERVTNLYDVMDSAYDVPKIHDFTGFIQIIG